MAVRICLIGYEPLARLGGMVRSQHRIARLLAGAGYEVHLVRITSTPAAAEWDTTSGTIRAVEGMSMPAFEIRPWLSQPDTAYAAHEVVTALRQLDEQYNYAAFHCLGLMQSSYLAARAARDKPVIISGRGSDVNRGRFRLRWLAGMIWMLQRADRLTFVSSTMLDRADRLVPCRDRASVILNSIDATVFDTAAPDIPPDHDHVILGGAGDFSLKKGSEMLAYVLHTLRQRGFPVRLRWFGAPDHADTLRGRFAGAVDDLIQAGAIEIVGEVPHHQMVRCLRSLDVFVLASIDEGCPNVLLEAMLAGRAVVAMGVGAIPEIVRDEREGLLVPPYDAAALVEALAALITQPERCAALGQAAYDRVTADFIPEHEQAAWLRVYDGLLRRRIISMARTPRT